MSMAARDQLQKKTRLLVIAQLLVLVFTLLSTEYLIQKFPLLPFLLLALMVILVLIQIIGFKCINCKNRLGAITWNLTCWKMLAKKVEYCPYCGVQFDDQTDT